MCVSMSFETNELQSLVEQSFLNSLDRTHIPEYNPIRERRLWYPRNQGTKRDKANAEVERMGAAAVAKGMSKDSVDSFYQRKGSADWYAFEARNGFDKPLPPSGLRTESANMCVEATIGIRLTRLQEEPQWGERSFDASRSPQPDLNQGPSAYHCECMYANRKHDSISMCARESRDTVLLHHQEESACAIGSPIPFVCGPTVVKAFMTIAPTNVDDFGSGPAL